MIHVAFIWNLKSFLSFPSGVLHVSFLFFADWFLIMRMCSTAAALNWCKCHTWASYLSLSQKVELLHHHRLPDSLNTSVFYVCVQLCYESASLQGVCTPLVHAWCRGAGVRRDQSHVQWQQTHLCPRWVLIPLWVRHQLPLARARPTLVQRPSQSVESLIWRLPGKSWFLFFCQKL